MMSESPRILGVCWYTDEATCSISAPFLDDPKNNASADKNSVGHILPLSSLSVFCRDHQIVKIHLLISSPDECWVQRPAQDSPEYASSNQGEAPHLLNPSFAGALLFGLDTEHDSKRMAEPNIYSLDDASPLTVWMHPKRIQGLRKHIPQEIEVTCFFEPSFAIHLAESTVMNPLDPEKAGNAESNLLFFVAPHYVSAFWVNMRNHRLRDAMRIPLRAAEDLSFFIENAAISYPWLKIEHDSVNWIRIGIENTETLGVAEAVETTDTVEKCLKAIYSDLQRLSLPDSGIAEWLASRIE